MRVSPFESDTAPRTADGPGGSRAETSVRPEMRASPRGDDGDRDDRREEEAIEEPGYGHGV